MKQTIRLSAVVCALLALSGCTVGPNYSTPQVDLPEQFDLGSSLLPRTLHITEPTTAATTTQPTNSTSKPSAEAAATTRPSIAPVDLQQWWLSFDDPELNSLVDRAVSTNDDVAIALARLHQARASLAAIGAAELPSADFSTGLGRGSGTNSTKGRVGAPLNAGTDTGKVDEITEVAGFDAGWETDFWGQLRREAEAARANVAAAENDRKYVLVSVIADTARAYSELRALQTRLKITQANVAALQRTVDLTRLRRQRQLGNELDIVLAERQLSAALARVAPLAASIRVAERRIAILLGESPDALYEELDQPAKLPIAPATFDVGVPMEVIRRRPDVGRVERQLAAATARVGVAAGDLFPQLALTAGVGIQGEGLGRAPNQIDTLWSVGPAFRMPLLDFGRLDSLVQLQDFRAEEAAANYRKTVLVAVQEVEDALGNYQAERNRLEQLTVAVASSERAVNLATQRFDLGLADFLNVLDAQRQLYDLQDQLAASQQAMMINLVAVFKALGGGWEGLPSVPPIRPPQPAVIAAGNMLFKH